MDGELLAGFKKAKKITKKFAKTFYLASHFLPKDKRYASYAVYAICRLSDESVDDLPVSEQISSLKELEQKIATAYSEDKINEYLLVAFRQTIKDYKIPKEYFDELIKGMQMDLEIKRYPDFPSLFEYCYRVAGVVGLIMLKILGPRDKAAEDHAVKLGVAMQLTNILRDIKEDFIRGRIYLPQDELLRFNLSEEQLSKGKNSDNFKNFMRFQILRCRKFYNESLQGIRLIDNQASRVVVLAMKENYSRILDSIEINGYNVFTKRAHVKKLNKILVILKILCKKKY